MTINVDTSCRGRRIDAYGILTSMVNSGLIDLHKDSELGEKYSNMLFESLASFSPVEAITCLKQRTEDFFNKYGVEDDQDYVPMEITMHTLEEKRKLEQESDSDSDEEDYFILSECEDDNKPCLRYYNNCYQNFIPDIYYKQVESSSPTSGNDNGCFELGGLGKSGNDSSFSPSMIDLSKKKKKKKAASSSRDSDRTGSSGSESQEDDDYMPSSTNGISKKAKLKKKRRSNAKRACHHCRRSHLRCNNERPCSRCLARGLECYDME